MSLYCYNKDTLYKWRSKIYSERKVFVALVIILLVCIDV